MADHGVPRGDRPPSVTTGQIARYLAGELPPEEDERVYAWLQAHPDVRAELEGVAPGIVPNVEAALARLRQDPARRHGDRAAHEPIRREERRPRPRRMRWASAAAAVAAVAVLIALLFILPTSPAERTYAASAGDRISVKLEDGSTVILNAASILSVDAAFGSRSRVVRLDGEAYFDVASDAQSPFTIRTPEATVTVLGTAFNVDAHSGGPVAVVVAEGLVRLESHSGNAVELRRGERGRILPATARIVTDRFSIDDAAAWREGRLVFRGTPLQEVARRIERQYDVHVRVHPAVDQRRLDASFHDHSVHEIADLVAAALDVEVTVADDTMTFSSQRTAP